MEPKENNPVIFLGGIYKGSPLKIRIFQLISDSKIPSIDIRSAKDLNPLPLSLTPRNFTLKARQKN